MARIAFLLENDFEDVEFQVPYDRLVESGHDVVVLGVHDGARLHGKKQIADVDVDFLAAEADPGEYDAIVIPGGYSPDKLRMDDAVVTFVKSYARTGKPIAAVCHGPSLLIDAELVKGKKIASWPSIRKDLENAGATWVDQPVVEDGSLITSRNPDDLQAFSDAILKRLNEVRPRRAAGAAPPPVPEGP
jgi:protease I